MCFSAVCHERQDRSVDWLMERWMLDWCRRVSADQLYPYRVLLLTGRFHWKAERDRTNTVRWLGPVRRSSLGF